MAIYYYTLHMLSMQTGACVEKINEAAQRQYYHWTPHTKSQNEETRKLTQQNQSPLLICGWPCRFSNVANSDTRCGLSRLRAQSNGVFPFKSVARVLAPCRSSKIASSVLPHCAASISAVPPHRLLRYWSGRPPASSISVALNTYVLLA